VVNDIINIMWMKDQLDNSLTCMLQQKKTLKFIKKWVWYGLLKIRLHFKTLRFSWIIFCIYVIFVLIYHILSPYNIIQIKSQTKMYLYKATNKRPIHIFQFQKFNTLYLENICYIFFIQVENCNSMENLA